MGQRSIHTVPYELKHKKAKAQLSPATFFDNSIADHPARLFRLSHQTRQRQDPALRPPGILSTSSWEKAVFERDWL